MHVQTHKRARRVQCHRTPRNGNLDVIARLPIAVGPHDVCLQRAPVHLHNMAGIEPNHEIMLSVVHVLGVVGVDIDLDAVVVVVTGI